MSESELHELAEVLAQPDDTLVAMIAEPAVDSRPPYLQANSVLSRFLSFSRFHTGRGEFG